MLLSCGLTGKPPVTEDASIFSRAYWPFVYLLLSRACALLKALCFIKLKDNFVRYLWLLDKAPEAGQLKKQTFLVRVWRLESEIQGSAGLVSSEGESAPGLQSWPLPVSSRGPPCVCLCPDLLLL